MLDIKFIRENPEAVKENIKKKFQDAKLPLVDQVIDLDAKRPGGHRRGGPAPVQPQRPLQADRHADGPGQEGPVQACRRPRPSSSR